LWLLVYLLWWIIVLFDVLFGNHINFQQLLRSHLLEKWVLIIDYLLFSITLARISARSNYALTYILCASLWHRTRFLSLTSIWSQSAIGADTSCDSAWFAVIEEAAMIAVVWI
jgi:hypothetical protein